MVVKLPIFWLNYYFLKSELKKAQILENSP